MEDPVIGVNVPIKGANDGPELVDLSQNMSLIITYYSRDKIDSRWLERHNSTSSHFSDQKCNNLGFRHFFCKFVCLIRRLHKNEEN